MFLHCLVAAVVALVLAASMIACAGTTVESSPEPGPAVTATPVAHQRTAVEISPVASPTPVVADSPTAAIPTQGSLGNPTPGAKAGRVPETELSAVDSTALAQRVYAYLVQLTRDHSPRASATEQEFEAAKYLTAIYQRLGYSTNIQTFEVNVLVTDPPVVRVEPARSPGADPIAIPSIDAQPLRLSAEGTTSGPLGHVGLVLGDLPVGSLTGKVALIERGIIPFEMKVSRVTQAGAVAAVIYNNQPGQFSGMLTSRARIPVVSISQETGQELRVTISTSEVRATVSVVFENRQSRNVVAERIGQEATQEASKVIVLGGHFDTVPNVPGANDNGSGVATLLAIADAIKDRDYPFTVRFVDFGAEELGLEGSRHYLAALSTEERRKIVVMMNFDALGTGAAGVFGTDDLTNRALSGAQALSLELSREANIQGGSSDFASFEAAGIPFLFFLADDFSRIHTSEDTIEYIDSKALGTAAAVAIEVLDGLARAN